MWIVLAFFMIWCSIFGLNSEPKMLTDLKDRYRRVLELLKQTGDPMWKPVLSQAILTGIYGKKDGVIGSNVNKGYEIYICLDGGDVNSAMYVLIHELAHMTVPEYDHSTKFWDNFKKLKDLCEQNDLYMKSGTRKYCGETITE